MNYIREEIVPMRCLNLIAEAFQQYQSWRLESIFILQRWEIYHKKSDKTQKDSLRKKINTLQRVCGGFDNRVQTVVIFFEIAKTYDKVWHSNLIYKWIKLKVLNTLIKIIYSFLSDRNFSVHYAQHARSISAGVPQGSKIGPILFNLYNNNDITKHPHTTLAQCADDTAISLTWKTWTNTFKVTLILPSSGFRSEGLKLVPTNLLLPFSVPSILTALHR